MIRARDAATRVAMTAVSLPSLPSCACHSALMASHRRTRGVPAPTTTNRHGWRPWGEGACAAAASNAAQTASGTGVSRKRRTLWRLYMASWRVVSMVVTGTNRDWPGESRLGHSLRRHDSACHVRLPPGYDRFCPSRVPPQPRFRRQ